MGTKYYDFNWIQTRLTLARWYLDAAASAAEEAVRHHVQQAQNMYDITVGLLSQLEVNEDQWESIERELSDVRIRLQPLGSGCDDVKAR